MNVQKILDNFIKIQNDFLDFINDESIDEDKFYYFKELLNQFQIKKDPQQLKILLHIILKISNNHQRNSTFFQKIEQLILFLKDEIIKYYSNQSIFNIFKSNKRILLFLVKEKIVIFDEFIVKSLLSQKYIEGNYLKYFAPEIKPFVNEKWFLHDEYLDVIKYVKADLPENFEINRKNGVNEHYICMLIRNDMIQEFITFISKCNIKLDSEIDESIYETNNLLIKVFNNFQRIYDETDSVSLIAYAAFYGSIKIFKYLAMNDVKLTPSLWIFAIHSNSADLISFLEDNQINMPTSFQDYKISKFFCFCESIKCHHTEIANYLSTNYFSDDCMNSRSVFITSLKNFNFNFLQKDLINQNSFYDFCKYDHITFVDLFIMEKDVDINKTHIFKQKIILYNFK